MSFITKEDLGSHIFEQNIDVITQNDDSKVTTAIETAINEATGYLSRFDYEAIFATSDPEQRKKYSALINHIKDMAKWYVCRASNAGVDLELAKECFDDAIEALEKIQNRKTVYRDWPLVQESVAPSASFHISSRPKRTNYY